VWLRGLLLKLERYDIKGNLLLLFISYDFSPMDVSSANNLHKPIVSSAMSLTNTKKRRVPRMDHWGNPALRFDNREIMFNIL
jgi:hypothetical protein